jgi:hypothetical protein
MAGAVLYTATCHKLGVAWMIDKDELHNEYNKGLAIFRKSLYQVIQVHGKARHIRSKRRRLEVLGQISPP